MRDVVATVTTPVKALKDFQRVFIKAGASTVVKFSVDVASELKILGRDFQWAVEPGDFRVYIGGSSAGTGKPMGTFTVV